MADQRRVETEEERRARIRRARRRRELRRRRRRRRQILHLIKLGAMALALILALIGIFVVVRKYRTDKAAKAAAEAQAAEDAKTLQQFAASDVLHLSFPVLTIVDHDEDEKEDTFIDEDGDGIPDDVDETEAVSSESEEEEAHALTVDEFNEILQELYEQNYVLVDVYALAGSTETGMSEKKVSVPIGKKPLIISEYNTSYSAGFDGHADQLVFENSGAVTCSYTTKSGELKQGAVDVIPCLEAFIAKHSDFSYNGARGIIGATGYRGLFGYQIQKDSKLIGSLSDEAIQAMADHGAQYGIDDESPTEDETENTDAADEKTTDAETEAVSTSSTAETIVDDAAIAHNISALGDLITVLRKSGWHFACNSYDYISYASSFSMVQKDVDLWKSELEPIIGTTDILMLPLGADLDNWSGYREDNAKYQYLKEQGMRFYCIDDPANLTWLQVTDGYVRQGIHEIDNINTFYQVMEMGV